MEMLMDDFISPQELVKFEKTYHDDLEKGSVSTTVQFNYAWALIRSRYQADIQKGVVLMEDLVHRGEESAKRDYLFYLATGHTKLKEYKTALHIIKKFLEIEPGNRQAQMLEKVIKERLKKEGLMGMAIVGGAAAVAVGGLVGLGIALCKK